MEETSRNEGSAPPETGQPSVSADVDVGGAGGSLVGGEGGDALAPSEAFQTLASEVRVAVLVELLASERADEDPVSFSRLQSAVGADSSAGFAYHLRLLSGHFVRQRDAGYVLTEAGRRAANAVVDGTFTDGGEPGRAS